MGFFTCPVKCFLMTRDSIIQLRFLGAPCGKCVELPDLQMIGYVPGSEFSKMLTLRRACMVLGLGPGTQACKKRHNTTEKLQHGSDASGNALGLAAVV